MPDATLQASRVEVSILRFNVAAGTASDDLAMLDDAERQRESEFTAITARARYVTSHAFVRRVLGQYLDADPAGLRYDRACEHCGHTSHGRPRLVDRSSSFSLSHSESRVVVAVAEGPVGADVEDITRRPVAERVIRRCCCAGELAWLAGRPAGDRPVDFLRLWTKKEALTKALGLGVVVPFGGIDVLGSAAIAVRQGAPPLVAHALDLVGAVGAVAVAPGAVMYRGPLSED